MTYACVACNKKLDSLYQQLTSVHQQLQVSLSCSTEPGPASDNSVSLPHTTFPAQIVSIDAQHRLTAPCCVTNQLLDAACSQASLLWNIKACLCTHRSYSPVCTACISNPASARLLQGSRSSITTGRTLCCAPSETSNDPRAASPHPSLPPLLRTPPLPPLVFLLQWTLTI